MSILCYFPFLQTKHSWPEYLFCPALLIAPSHLSPLEGFPSTWDSHSLPQGKRLLLYNRWQTLNKQYGQTQIQTMIVNIFSSVADSNVLISSCLPAWGSLQLWKAKHSAERKSLLISKVPVEPGLEVLPSGYCSIRCHPQTTELSNQHTQLAALTSWPPSACWAPGAAMVGTTLRPFKPQLTSYSFPGVKAMTQ